MTEATRIVVSAAIAGIADSPIDKIAEAAKPFKTVLLIIVSFLPLRSDVSLCIPANMPVFSSFVSRSALHREVIRFRQNQFVEWPDTVLCHRHNNLNPVTTPGKVMEVEFHGERHARF